MRWSPEVLYERSVARDRAWDGRFFMGVTSTGIVCLASCPARKPRFDRVRFFATLAEAREAGFRPCLRCRPDAFRRGEDPDLAALEGLLARVQADPAAWSGVEDLADALGCGTTRLGDLVREHAHASPAQLLQRARVARAARSLVGGASVLDAGLEVGFASASAFHEAFRRRMGLTPGAYARMLGETSFSLSLPAHYRVADTLAFHGRDPLSRCERVEGPRLRKALTLQGLSVILDLGFAMDRVQVTVWGGSGGALMAQAHARVLRMLGLGLDPGPFERGVGAELARGREGLRIPQTAEVWEALVWAVLGQQVNLAFAHALRRDLVARFGTPLPGGLFTHPGPEALARAEPADLVALRLSRAKAETLLRVARVVTAGELDLEGMGAGTATGAAARLCAQKGIGPWTAQYVLMRGCGFADCVPVGDAGLTLALQRRHGLDHRPDPVETRALLTPFAPHRSLAVFHLWASLKGTPA